MTVAQLAHPPVSDGRNPVRPAAIAVVSVATFLVVAGCTATPDETDSPPVPDDVWSVELTEAFPPLT